MRRSISFRHCEVLYYYLIFSSGRDRWVKYSRKDHDASQVPPEWYELKVGFHSAGVGEGDTLIDY